MEIKTCEQYVLTQLSNKEKEVEDLKTALANVQADLAHKEEALQTCIELIKLADFSVSSTYSTYLKADCFTYIDENIRKLIEFVINEIHIEIPNYNPQEEN